MKKAELISAIAEKTNLTKTDINTVLCAFGEVVTANVKDGNIVVPNLGTFKLRTNKARDGINPATKEAIKIEQSFGLAFKQSTKTKGVLNG